MYRIPSTLDLRPVVGEATTQLRVGQFDIQFTFGPLAFAIQSPIRLFRGGQLIAQWDGSNWPEAGFRDVMNQKVVRCDIVSDTRIVFEFQDGLEMHLEDNSDQYESMQIACAGNPKPYII